MATEIKKLESMLKGMLDQQNQKLDEACSNTSLNVDRNARSIAEMNDLVCGLSVQVSKLVADKNSGSRSPSPFQHDKGPGNHYQYSTRLTKVEFPKFDGTNLKPWLYKCTQFFELDKIEDPYKVKIAAIHLEGKTLLWHPTYVKRKGEISLTWEEYVTDLTIRFGEPYDDPMAELKALKQGGSVQDYHDSFDAIASRLELTEKDLLSCYVGGLEDEIQMQVRMFTPQNIQHALCLAKLQESTNKFRKTKNHNRTPPLLPTPTQTRPFQNTFHHKTNLNPTYNTNPKTQNTTNGQNNTPLNNRKTYTSAEFNDRRAKGLCFWCDEKCTSVREGDPNCTTWK